MKLRIVSDLHLERHRDGGLCLLTEIQHNPDFDVLVVAGDLADANTLQKSLRMVARTVEPKPVVYVLGNHELYGGSPESAYADAKEVADSCKNLHVLEQDVLELQGQRFIGCTLWYPHPVWLQTDYEMGDFEYIEGFRDWIHDYAKSSDRFLRNNIQEGDVVVTHFLPHLKSILPRFKRSPINGYFVHNVGDVVEHGGAKLWIHGHTHGSLNYRVGGTRVICNPHGYVNSVISGEPNEGFRAGLTVEV